MSKQIKVGDRVVFMHTNPDLHDRMDGETGTVTGVITDGFLFEGTAYELEYPNGILGLAFRNELTLAEDALVG